MLVKLILPSGNPAVYEVPSLKRDDGTKLSPEDVRWYNQHVATKFFDGWQRLVGGGWMLASESDGVLYDSLDVYTGQEEG